METTPKMDPPENDILTCPRQNLVDGIYDRLIDYQVVMIRGTPASGKTTLLKLLRKHILNMDKENRVFTIYGFPSVQDSNTSNPRMANDREIKQLVIDELGYNPVENPSSGPHFLLIDECQDSHYGLWLWNTFIKSVHDGGIGFYIVLFSCYGSSTGEVLDRPIVGSSIRFAPPQLVELARDDSQDYESIGLLLDPNEATEILNKRGQAAKPPFTLEGPLMEDLYHFSNGHCGVLVGLYQRIARDSIIKNKRKRVKDYTVTKQVFEETFFSDPTTYRLFQENLFTESFNRGFPSVQAIRDPLNRDILLTIIKDGECTKEHIIDKLRTKHNSALIYTRVEEAWQRGFVHRTKKLDDKALEVLVFPSYIHLWHCQRYLVADTSAITNFSTPLDMVAKLVHAFKPSCLNNPPRRVTLYDNSQTGKLVEDNFCYEFYRAAFQILKGDFEMCPQFGTRGVSGLGVIDFFFGLFKWGIEITKEATLGSLYEHYMRFMPPSGKYHKWITSGHMVDFLIVDFRMKLPDFKLPDNAKCIVFVVFEKDFSGVTIFDHEKKEIVPKTGLFE